MPLWLIALLVHSWWIIPVLGLIYVTFRDQIRDAREHNEPVSSVFLNAGSGLLALIVKGVVIVAALAIVVIVGSFIAHIFSGSSYGPDYDAWRR
ncbi:hypothetical protein [Sphingomonas sp.]|uniref:hypothetical protein n=1 Tax=Sphingomonas sp. TaxID=28214 RepID=UPI002DB5EB89|nr:hypothetical protein [Sphingomonas sp.]HEU4969543.1 hypothetical protein [Sphingomonas sp.]